MRSQVVVRQLLLVRVGAGSCKLFFLDGKNSLGSPSKLPPRTAIGLLFCLSINLVAQSNHRSRSQIRVYQDSEPDSHSGVPSFLKPGLRYTFFLLVPVSGPSPITPRAPTRGTYAISGFSPSDTKPSKARKAPAHTEAPMRGFYPNTLNPLKDQG